MFSAPSTSKHAVNYNTFRALTFKHAVHKMKCMGGRGHVRNQDVDLADDGLLFAEAEAELVPAQFLKTKAKT